MNKYNIIFIVLIIIFIILFFIKNKNEYFSAESLFNIFAPCKDVINGDVNFNNVNIEGTLQIGGTQPQDISQIIRDTLFPYGSFYVQYPDKNSNSEVDAFPVSKSPAKLFGGDWQEQWPEESIFFRTRGKEASVNRTKGFQDDALITFWGKSSFNQTNMYFKSGKGATGVFGGQVGLTEIGTDAGTGDDVGHINYFDIGTQIKTSELETRVKNRQIKVWKRVRRNNNGSLPELPENGHDPQYDNVYFEGPTPCKVFSSQKYFNEYDKVNTYQKAWEKCKQLGDTCKGVQMTDDKPNVFTYSSDGIVSDDVVPLGGLFKNLNLLNSNYTLNKVWLKKKVEDVL